MRLASVNEVPPGHNTNPPVMIHCSEGGGRAGVTLASDLLLYTLDHNQVRIQLLLLDWPFGEKLSTCLKENMLCNAAGRVIICVQVSA